MTESMAELVKQPLGSDNAGIGSLHARVLGPLIEKIPAASAITVGRDGLCAWANRAFLALPGMRVDPVGRPLADMLSQCFGTSARSLITTAIETGRPAREPAATPDGLRWDIACEPIEGEQAMLVTVVPFPSDEEESIGTEAVEEKLQFALEAARAYVWEYDPLTRRTRRTPNAETVLGVSAGRLCADAIFDEGFIHPDDRLRLRSTLEALEREGKGFEAEIRVLREDGSTGWVCDRGRLIRDAEGRLRMAGIVLDITERKQAENDLRLNQERLALALDAGEIGTWDWDLETKHVNWSERTRRMLRGPADSMPTIEVAVSHLPPEDAEGLRSLISRTARMELPRDLEYEFRIHREDGSIGWLALRGRALASEDGTRIVRMIGTLRDITRRKDSERILRDRDTWMRQLADAMPQIVWVSDAEGAIEYANRRWFDYAGSWGSLTDQLAHVHADDHEDALFAWEEAKRGGHVFECEMRLRRHDGVWRRHLVRGTPVRDADGIIVRWYGTATDIHEQKNIESALCALIAEKDHLLDRSEMLMREVDHRVKNSLGLISSLLTLQAVQSRDPHTRAQFHEANNRVLTIAQVHQRLYQLAHGDRVDFGPYLEGLCRDLGHSLGCAEKRLRIHVMVGCAVSLQPDCVISLALAVNELVTNAVKYAYPFGSPGCIAVSLEQTPAGGLRLIVEDDGTGLPADFDPTRTSSLGMRIISALVQGLDGEISIANASPGARFSITLPPAALA